MKRDKLSRASCVCLLALLAQAVFGVSLGSVVADEVPTRGEPSSANGAEPDKPTSIFNDKLRSFQFQLEHTVVNFETAETFLLIYKGHDRPAIVGAYPDADTNSLIVVGPPEAEQAIRETLAMWMVESFALVGSSLKIKRRELAFDRRKLIESIADLEIEMVQPLEDERAEEKVKQLKARAESFADELAIVEKKLEIADHYLDVLEDAE